jgi:hypothetical protein
MSAILQHARKHYFKGAYAQTLFGDLSAIGGVPTFDAYGVQVPKLDTLLFPFTLSQEQEETLKRTIPSIRGGMIIEADQEGKNGQLLLRSTGFLRKRRHLLLSSEGQKLKLTLLSEKEEPLLDTLLRESVLGEALIEFWINSGFFKRRNLDDFEKQLVVEAALEEHTDDDTQPRKVTAEDAAKELEKARKLLLEITPKAQAIQTVKNA